MNENELGMKKNLKKNSGMKDLNESSNENFLSKCYLCIILEVKLELKSKIHQNIFHLN